jgi:hypothetical protein
VETTLQSCARAWARSDRLLVGGGWRRSFHDHVRRGFWVVFTSYLTAFPVRPSLARHHPQPTGKCSAAKLAKVHGTIGSEGGGAWPIITGDSHSAAMSKRHAFCHNDVVLETSHHVGDDLNVKWLPMCKLSNHYRTLCSLVCCCMDFLMIMSAIALAIVLHFSSDNLAMLNGQHYVLSALLVTVVCQLCLYYANLYELHLAVGLAAFLGKLGSALAAATLTLVGLFYAWPLWGMGRGVFALSMMFIFCFLTIWRLLYQKLHNTSWLRVNLLIIGTDEDVQQLTKAFADKQFIGYELQGALGKSDEVDEGFRLWHEC